MQGSPLSNRRTFLRGISGAAVGPMIVRADVLGRGATPPSDRIVMGLIGAGARGMYDLTHFMKEPVVRLVAVADCFASRREEARQLVDETTEHGSALRTDSTKSFSGVPTSTLC